MRPSILAILCLAAALVLPAHTCAEELEMINRPVNAQGLTGLLFTTSPYTLPRRTFEIGLSTLSERSFSPEYTVNGYPVTVSYGLGRSMEVALKASYWYQKNAAQEGSRGFSDAELAFKWCVLPPREYSSRPSVAVLLKGAVPTGDRTAGTNTVINWGAGIGLSIGGEVFIEDYVMGYYADGMLLAQDLSSTEKRDQYYTANAGILLPISKYRNLQMFLEYNILHDHDRISLYEVDYTAVTYGLRLVNSRYNLTFGTQFKRRADSGYDNASRITLIASMKI
jgi:hypothetical protein